jgi:hypothetical protein
MPEMKMTLSCGVAVLGYAATMAVACENPAVVAIPDGKTATMEQLLAAQAEVKSYMAAMEEYLTCVQNELQAKGEDAPTEFKTLMVARHNAAVNEMESVAAAFNQQVQAFRAANPETAAN